LDVKQSPGQQPEARLLLVELDAEANEQTRSGAITLPDSALGGTALPPNVEGERRFVYRLESSANQLTLAPLRHEDLVLYVGTPGEELEGDLRLLGLVSKAETSAGDSAGSLGESVPQDLLSEALLQRVQQVAEAERQLQVVASRREELSTKIGTLQQRLAAARAEEAKGLAELEAAPDDVPATRLLRRSIATQGVAIHELSSELSAHEAEIAELEKREEELQTQLWSTEELEELRAQVTAAREQRS